MPGDMRVDWFRLLADLKRAGLSMYAVAELTGIPRTTISNYQNGAEPRHSIGEALVRLWIRTLGSTRDGLPLARVELSAAKLR